MCGALVCNPHMYASLPTHNILHYIPLPLTYLKTFVQLKIIR